MILLSCIEKDLIDAETLSKSIKKKSENIDLFAVDDKKSDIKDGIKSINSETSAIDIKSTGSYMTQINNRSYVIEQQAELLRLEAEKEQLQIDSIRIENEQVLYIFISLLLKYDQLIHKYIVYLVV